LVNINDFKVAVSKIYQGYNTYIKGDSEVIYVVTKKIKMKDVPLIKES